MNEPSIGWLDFSSPGTTDTASLTSLELFSVSVRGVLIELGGDCRGIVSDAQQEEDGDDNCEESVETLAAAVAAVSGDVIFFAINDASYSENVIVGSDDVAAVLEGLMDGKSGKVFIGAHASASALAVLLLFVTTATELFGLIASVSVGARTMSPEAPIVVVAIVVVDATVPGAIVETLTEASIGRVSLLDVVDGVPLIHARPSRFKLSLAIICVRTHEKQNKKKKKRKSRNLT